MISVYFEANVSSNKPQGFNASFWVRKCHHSSDEEEGGSPVCPSGSLCQGGICQCPQGYGGPHCDRPVCPQDCGITEGRGTCNIVRTDLFSKWNIYIWVSSSNKSICGIWNVLIFKQWLLSWAISNELCRINMSVFNYRLCSVVMQQMIALKKVPHNMFIRTNNPKLLTICISFCQSLGVCVCSDSWVGSDCSVPRDSNSLVWETLLDTQLTVVSTGYDQ